MANTLLTSTKVTREALRILHQKLTFVGSINRQYDDQFAQSGAKDGDSIKIRLPNQYKVRTGKTLDAQPTSEKSVTLQVATQKGVDLNFSTAELTLSLDDFSKRIIEPAMNVLAADIEADALAMRKDVYQQADNTAATITFANVLSGRRKLNDALTPNGDRSALLNSADSASLVDTLKGLFQDSEAIKKQYREGMMGRTAGFDFMETSHLNTQSRGAGDANYTTDTRTSAIPVSATEKSSITVASGTGALNKGEIFTIANVFRVHPETRVSTGIKQQFVVTADYAGGGGSLSFSPAMVLDGPYQNVVIPSTSATAAIVISGTASTDYGQSMVYHKDAFVFATADLVMPKGVDFGAREVFDGISMRIVRQYDINNDNLPCRLDVLYGYRTVRPQLACRLANLAPA